MAFWRRDGKEISFLAPDRSILSVSLSTSPDFEFAKPKVLFRLPETTPVAPNMASVNRDADQFVIAVPPPQLRQLTMLDREGKTVGTVGQPGRFGDVRFSPDGKRLLVVKIDPQTGINNIWVFDIATGKATAMTNETQSVNAPVWSRDGKQIAYVQFKDSYSSIYRKAADGTGNAELLFRYTPGAFVGLVRLVPRFEVSDFHHRRLADRAGAKRGKGARPKSSGMVAGGLRRVRRPILTGRTPSGVPVERSRCSHDAGLRAAI